LLINPPCDLDVHGRTTARALSRPFAAARTVLARRGGRYPVRAHTGAVSAALRLRCDARARVAPRNSLHSLRSLRSDNRGESDERSALRAPTPARRFSPPHKSPTPGTAHRAATLVVFVNKEHGGAGKAVGGCATAATCAAPRNAELMAARASALRALTRRDCPSTANAVSGASFATGHEIEYRRGPSAKRRAAAFERRCIPARGLASHRSAQRC
jgi:hypothetical protein